MQPKTKKSGKSVGANVALGEAQRHICATPRSVAEPQTRNIVGNLPTQVGNLPTYTQLEMEFPPEYPIKTAPPEGAGGAKNSPNNT